MTKYRVGVDVGGTNTDAAIIDILATDAPSRGVCASTKTPTTADVTSGIYAAIQDVLEQSHVDRQDVVSVAIGTTHFVNAVVQADSSRLSQVAVVRLCGPFTKQVPPFAEFPSDLKGIMGGPVLYLDGGLEIDGREIAPLNVEQIRATVQSIQDAGIKMVALLGVFSPLDHSGIHEETCKKLMLGFDPSLSIVCSHAIGRIGFLERENATILNASILSFARKTVRAFCSAMAKLQLHGAELPIKTFASGPTNSMTGAAFLASLDRGGSAKPSDQQVLVVDIGGTTTDVCALLPSGLPRQAPNFVEVGGVRTAFSMPEVLSVGLGGGSRVGVDGHTGAVRVGPESVGHSLTSRARVFGGDVLTATDIVTASGRAEIGDREKVKDIPAQIVTKARQQIRKILERAIDGMKISNQPVVLLLVGGGSVVHMDALNGVAECIIPPHHDSANAVGAAIAKVAGEIDVIELLEGRDEKQVLEAAKQRAIDAAMARGAEKEGVRIATIEKIPLAYATNKATRLVIKAIGSLTPLDVDNQAPRPEAFQENIYDHIEANEEESIQTDTPREAAHFTAKPSLQIDLDTYKPDVRNNTWYISPVDLEFMAAGTGVLGTGGGGPSRIQYLHCLQFLQCPGYAGNMRVVKPASLRDSDICVMGSWFGAPSVSSERLSAGTELALAIESCVRITGKKDFHAIVTDEIGGGNGLSAFPSGVIYDIPVVDGDLMGRAYPTLEHCTPYVYGLSATPCAVADGRGNVSIILHAESSRRAETMARSQCVDLGNKVALSTAPLTGAETKKYIIPNTISQAWYIGRAVYRARQSKTDMIQAIFDTSPGKLLYTGKVTDVKRDVSRGYTMGYCLLAPLSSDERETTISSSCGVGVLEESRCLVIPFQNEFLYAAYTDPDGPEDESKQEVICSVPDLISILGQDGEAIGSQELRYGLKVNVIAMAAHPLWTTKKGLSIGGPQGFGLDMEWTKLGEYWEPRSVIEEFNRVE
ncbi:hydantoinase/oxoprolinase [Aspergillus bombycis]|uniref:Hydantoinase/oxoprolinase n=1 Tax=Aspergillus bombycis TaxID=109264 RepID=A0A1F7ZY58_9EURO|nr:hydantoinase/oxoprolinase [Aspergillus bombycis]OGM44413.1 hydantoinase/oxoprolinase [Aspergillus bombycis]